jgi:hypothetical protein
MIQDEVELHASYQTLAKLTRLRESSAEETLWDAGTREDVVEGIDSQIEKIEREITEFLERRRAETKEAA